MRLVTFERRGQVRLGALVPAELVPEGLGSFVLDLVEADARLPGEMSRLLGAGERALDLARAAVAAASPAALLPAAHCRLRAPLQRPGKIICIGYNYLGHGAAGSTRLPEFPDVFAKTTNTIVGPGGDIVLPRVSREVDYEAELAVVIGRRAHDVTEDAALEHVAGYTMFNDVSARDYQGRGSQWLLGKSFDTFGPLGPAIVTADEVSDPQSLDVELTVNGVTRQRANTRDMIFTIGYLVAYVSQVMTLNPGDIIATGTPAKLPDAAREAQFLARGDVVAITIGDLGTLSNRVTDRSVGSR